MIVKKTFGFFDTAIFWNKFHLVKGYPFILINVFGLQKAYGELKAPFLALWDFFPKKKYALHI